MINGGTPWKRRIMVTKEKMENYMGDEQPL
jgi:hypothetical protein